MGYAYGSMNSDILSAKEAYNRAKEHMGENCMAEFNIDITKIEDNWVLNFERGYNQSRADLAAYCNCKDGYVSAANDEFLIHKNDTTRIFNFEVLQKYCPKEQFEQFQKGWNLGLPERKNLTNKMASSMSEYLFSNSRRQTARERAEISCAQPNLK